MPKPALQPNPLFIPAGDDFPEPGMEPMPPAPSHRHPGFAPGEDRDLVVTQSEADWVTHMAQAIANVVIASAEACPFVHADCLIAAALDGAIRRLAAEHEHLPVLVGHLLTRGR